MKKILSILVVIVPLFCNAQTQGNIWYFGEGAGLDFNSGTPISILGGQTETDIGIANQEGCATISDSSGTLLFYTDGQKIWNKNHQTMSNGDSLKGNKSSSQSAFILPLPLNNHLYYVFTTDAFINNFQNGLCYSIVDMCLNNKIGGVVSGSKNIPLLNIASEKLTATKHANGVDYWVITTMNNTNDYYVYLLTQNGITDTVVSSVGAICGGANAYGQMKISPSGSKMAIADGQGTNKAIFFDFNNSTGVISNPTVLPSASTIYGVAFSSDNSKLYISEFLNVNQINQYDLSNGNNKTVISLPNNSSPKGMQLAPNGKIYVARQDSPDYLGVINNPNLAGTSANYVHNGIYLNGKTSDYGLPSFLDSYSYPNTMIDCETEINEVANKNLSIKVYPNPAQQYFNIELPNQQKFNLFVYDITGRKVYENKNAAGSVKVDCSNFNAGIYFVQAVNEKNILSIKLIKQ
ncbi:MAG: T9SS type A sorting domain-containing protein [Bacteroidota bacterium]